MDWAHGTGLANARQAETRAATRQVVASPKEAPGRLRQVSRWERGAPARRKTRQSQHKSKKPQAGTGEARGSTARLLRAASAAARGAGRRWRRAACAPSTSVPQAAGARCKPARRQSPSGRRCIEEDNRALSALQTNERQDRWERLARCIRRALCAARGKALLRCRTSAGPRGMRKEPLKFGVSKSVTWPPQHGFGSGSPPARTPCVALTAPKSSRQSSRLRAGYNGRDLAAARGKRSDRAGSSRGPRRSAPTHGASAAAAFARLGVAPHRAPAGNRRGHGRAWRMAVLRQHRFR